MAAVDITATSTGAVNATVAGLSLAVVLSLTATAVGSVNVTMAELTDRSLDVSARAIGSVEANVQVPTARLMGMSASARGQILATLGPFTRWLPLGATAIGQMNVADASLRNATPLGEINAVITGGKRRAAIRHANSAGLTVHDAAREVYNLWTIEITDPRTIEYCRDRVLGYINATVQTIHSRAHVLDFFNKQEIEITIIGGTNSLALTDTIQVVRGPVKLSATNAPLRKLHNRTELDNFTAYYYGETAAPSDPRAYFLDSRNQGKADNVLLTLYVAPTPVDNTPVKLEVAVEPPRYTAQDIMAATPLRIPHKFAETLFWPILRHLAATDGNYNGPAEQRQDIAAKHTEAMKALGLYTPPPAELEQTK